MLFIINFNIPEHEHDDGLDGGRLERRALGVGGVFCMEGKNVVRETSSGN